MKRKRRHTTDMEDLLAEDEDHLISVKTNSRASCQISNTSNNEQTLLESQSSILVGEFSKLGLQDKHRKRKRHCTRFVNHSYSIRNYKGYKFKPSAINVS